MPINVTGLWHRQMGALLKFDRTSRGAYKVPEACLLSGLSMTTDSKTFEQSPVSPAFESLLNSLPEAIIWLDHGARILFLNPLAQTLLGLSLAQARGKLAQEIPLLGKVFRSLGHILPELDSTRGEQWHCLQLRGADQSVQLYETT